MDPDIKFLTCSDREIDHLVEISKQFYPEHYRHIWKNNDPSYYMNLSFTQKAFEKDFQNENIHYFLITNSNNPVGLLKLRKHEEIDSYSNTEALQLEKIYLLATATGTGIGKKAIDFTKQYALSLNKKVIWLDVMTTSPALFFYQKMGFDTISRYHLDYPGIKEEHTEMQRMILTLL